MPLNYGKSVDFGRNPISTEYILSHKKKKVHKIFYILHKIFKKSEIGQKIIEYVKRKGGYFVGAGALDGPTQKPPTMGGFYAAYIGLTILLHGGAKSLRVVEDAAPYACATENQFT